MKDGIDAARLLGFGALRAFFVPGRDGSLVGMSHVTTYDRSGNVIGEKLEPTGVEVKLA